MELLQQFCVHCAVNDTPHETETEMIEISLLLPQSSLLRFAIIYDFSDLWWLEHAAVFPSSLISLVLRRFFGGRNTLWGMFLSGHAVFWSQLSYHILFFFQGVIFMFPGSRRNMMSTPIDLSSLWKYLHHTRVLNFIIACGVCRLEGSTSISETFTNKTGCCGGFLETRIALGRRLVSPLKLLICIMR